MLKFPHVSVIQEKVPAPNCHLIEAIREPGLEDTLEASLRNRDTAESKLPYNPLYLSQMIILAVDFLFIFCST